MEHQIEHQMEHQMDDMHSIDMNGGEKDDGMSMRRPPRKKAVASRLIKQAAVLLQRQRNGERLAARLVLDIIAHEGETAFMMVCGEIHDANQAERIMNKAVQALCKLAENTEDTLSDGILHYLANEQLHAMQGEPVLSLDHPAVAIQLAKMTAPGPSIEEVAEEAEFKRWARGRYSLSPEQRKLMALVDMFDKGDIDKEVLESRANLRFEALMPLVRQLYKEIELQERRLRKMFYSEHCPA